MLDSEAKERQQLDICWVKLLNFVHLQLRHALCKHLEGFLHAARNGIKLIGQPQYNGRGILYEQISKCIYVYIQSQTIYVYIATQCAHRSLYKNIYSIVRSIYITMPKSTQILQLENRT